MEEPEFSEALATACEADTEPANNAKAIKDRERSIRPPFCETTCQNYTHAQASKKEKVWAS